MVTGCHYSNYITSGEFCPAHLFMCLSHQVYLERPSQLYKILMFPHGGGGGGGAPSPCCLHSRDSQTQLSLLVLAKQPETTEKS